MSNYIAYHVHSYLSLLDSCTDFKLYIDKAKELGQTAIAISEHGKPLQWVHKKMYCDEVGIKYIHGVECYLTKALLQPDPQTGEMVKIRDNYHTVLLAKDYAGLLEINKAISTSTDEEHTYYVNRITFEEFLRLSNHVITTSACLASPLNKLSMDDPWYERLVKRYDFLEIQPHDSQDQIEFNQRLAFLAQKYNKPLIAGTDTHSLDAYKAECRQVLLDHKGQSYGNEDEFDMTYKTYDELVAAFRGQDAIPEALWMEAIENTNRMADMVQPFELDTALKYPKLYGSSEADREMMIKTIDEKLNYKLENGIIPRHQEKAFRAACQEELRVFDKIDMTGYILCMSELITWCWENGIPVGPARGSVGGSRIAYVTDIIDLNPETWHTVFSRFANEDRKEVGDIDVDVIDTDRPKIFKYLIDRFGQAYTARVPTWSTAAGMKAIEIIGKAFSNRWKKQNPGGTDEEDPFHAKKIAVIKKEFEANESAARKKYQDIFYYYDGLLGTPVAQSVHAAGMVVSPLTLADHYGVFWKDGELVMNIDMEEIHEVSLVKFDLLILNNIGIIADTCKMAGIPYPRSHEVDWNDPVVWEDMMRSPVGIFQMEGDFAFKLLRDFKTKSIFDMSLVTACIRPSGASYRNDLIARKPHKNPSTMIDELLKDNNGYLVYQEDVIKFLQQICGLSGSEADNVRRAIARKQMDRLEAALPSILEGYCSKSPKPRKEAESEANEFIQILIDASSYMFGYNHSVAYCLVGYLCAWLRCYHPAEFITSYLNHAKNDSDITGGTELAQVYGIKIMPPKFEVSDAFYAYDKETKTIAKGISSIKGYGEAVCHKFHEIGKKRHEYFVDALEELYQSSIKASNIAPLIKVDYFSGYGNSVELSKILELFDMFRPTKVGGKKQVDRKTVNGTALLDMVLRHGTDKTSKGDDAKKLTIIDIQGFMRDMESHMLSLGIKDVDIRVKMQNQHDILGYIDLTTNKKEDRRKLLLTDVVPLKSKKTDDVWGYAVFSQSIGTGKTSRLTLRASTYKQRPIKKGDIIFAQNVKLEDSGYWYLYDYHLIL